MPPFNDLDGKMPPARVALVAAGVISPLGLGFAATAEALKTNKDCVVPVTRFDVTNCRCKTAAEVSDERLAGQLNGRKSRRLHRASRMMIAALTELRAQDRQFQPE